MSRIVSFLVTVFIILGLSLPLQANFASAQTCSSTDPSSCTSDATCQTAGNYWCGGSGGSGPCVLTSAMTSCPGASPSPSPSYSCPSPSPQSCPAGSMSKLITPTSAGCPYYVCESTGTTSPSPSPSPTYTFSCSASTPQHCSTTPACEGIGGRWNTATNQCEGSTGGSCSTSTPGYCYTQSACEGATNYWCKTIYGNPYCIQSSTKSSCPTSSPSPSPIPSTGPCVSSTPWYCTTEPTCTGVGGYWNRNTGYCESKYQSPYPSPTYSTSPSPTYSPKPEICSKDQYWNCKTEPECRGIGAFWNQGYCANAPASCSAKEPWSCFDGTSCKGAGANWCEYAPDKGTSFCSQYECPGQKCSAKEPWNCFDDSSCKSAGANWCKNQYGGKDWCQQYSCPVTIPKPIICPAVYYTPKICGSDEEYKPTFDDSGCPTGGTCVKRETCPYERKPVCGVDGITYDNFCKAQSAGVKVEYEGYCGYKVKCDDSFVETHANKCRENGGTPEKYTRSDGCTDVYCKGVKPIPFPTITPPPGCKLVEDPVSGVKIYDCGQRECKQITESDRRLKKDSCYASGGTPEYFKDYAGCESLTCRYDERDKFKFKCPTENEVNTIVEMCNRAGLEATYEIIPGLSSEQCKVAKCKQPKDRVCPLLPKASCPVGTEERIDIGEDGCDISRCVSKEEVDCRPFPSQESFQGCKEKGGSLVVKQNDKGCVVFQECIKREDESEIEFEEVDKVPDTTELIDLALKLEKVSITLKQFSDKISPIAKYYEAQGSKEESERYSRVKSLFTSAGEELNKIRTEMREKLDKLTTDDVEVFKARLKHVRVILKKILYIMLGGEEAKNEILKTEECGTSFECFDKAFRTCQPAKMKAQVSVELTIEPEITGLESELCVMNVKGGSDSMTCKVKDYALGIGNPEASLMPYCEGTLKAKLEAAQKTPQPPTVATSPTTATTSPVAG